VIRALLVAAVIGAAIWLSGAAFVHFLATR
jgi:hypothetical protein